jgi:hypothetical protein
MNQDSLNVDNFVTIFLKNQHSMIAFLNNQFE